MKRGQVRVLGALVLAAAFSSLGASTALAQLKSVQGILSGVVRDSAGTPQMGASVQLIPESVVSPSPLDLFTNTQGIFRGDRLTPGLYTVRVTLAGFLPTLEQHVRVSANLTTLVRIQLESLFASLEQLRRTPSSAASEADDWKWVLRTATSVRPVLQWVEEDPLNAVTVDADSVPAEPTRGRLELTDGARRPGSVSNLPASPATAFAYDQRIGMSRLLLAGLMSYDTDSPAGGFATVWLPTGSLSSGPHTAMVLRESKLGDTGASFRGARIEQGGSLAFGDRAVLEYGGEYVLVGLGKPASSLRPRMRLDARISDEWEASLIFASMPTGPEPLDVSETGEIGNGLAAALNEMDAFPVLMWRNGRPVLESGFHEELAAERKLGSRGRLQVAAFHDDNGNVAVFGRGTNLPVADFFQDVYSNGFSYDGGSSSSWGTRAAYKEKLGDDIELTALYAFAGALTPSSAVVGPLREMFRTADRHAVGAKVSERVPRFGTRVTIGYQWISGTTITRVDSFGDTMFDMEPYFHVGVHQRLPKFGPGRWEANAECDNLFAQGYVTLNTQDGRLMLMPAFRTFRGGLSLQF